MLLLQAFHSNAFYRITCSLADSNTGTTRRCFFSFCRPPLVARWLAECTVNSPWHTDRNAAFLTRAAPNGPAVRRGSAPLHAAAPRTPPVTGRGAETAVARRNATFALRRLWRVCGSCGVVGQSWAPGCEMLRKDEFCLALIRRMVET